MSDAIVHPVLASTTVTEEARDFVVDLKKFYQRHNVPLGVGVVLVLSAFLNRSLLRRELTRLHFAVEVFESEGMDVNQFAYLDD